MGIGKLKKLLATGSLVLASSLGAMTPDNTPSKENSVETVQKTSGISSSRIINKAGSPIFVNLFQDQLQIMANTDIGAAILKDLPREVNFIIAPTPMYAEEAGFWDGENCTIYDDTLIASSGGAPALIAHEIRHAIQGYKYAKDYLQMPTEQQIVYGKIIEIETRLQDALMKEELYKKNCPMTRSYGFATADWMDYRRIKMEIAKKNPQLSPDQVERMAKTQFVVDTWQGNYQKEGYEQREGVRTFKDWIQTYNENCLKRANRRCLSVRPKPDITVNENLVKRHHEIMQEFIERMGIDVPADFFDDLKHDKSLMVIRNPQELAIIGKHFDKELKMVIMPRDNFIQVGGIVVAKDNSTLMFAPEKREEFKKEIQKKLLNHQTKRGSR